jgi:WD40 repeat protein
MVASASQDMTVRLWNTDTGRLQRTVEPYTGWVDAMEFSPDCKPPTYDISRFAAYRSPSALSCKRHRGAVTRTLYWRLYHGSLTALLQQGILPKR